MKPARITVLAAMLAAAVAVPARPPYGQTRTADRQAGPPDLQAREAAYRANNLGVPLVLDSPRAKVSRSLTALAHNINGHHKKG